MRIGPNDFIRAPARVDRKEDGDEAPRDIGVAVALFRLSDMRMVRRQA
jgi:hypothetical protein